MLGDRAISTRWWQHQRANRPIDLRILASSDVRSINNLLTVIQSCCRQRRSAFEFFEQAIEARVDPAVQAPCLIPQV